MCRHSHSRKQTPPPADPPDPTYPPPHRTSAHRSRTSPDPAARVVPCRCRGSAYLSDRSKNSTAGFFKLAAQVKYTFFFRNERDERDRRDDRNALRLTESIRKKHAFSKEYGFTPNLSFFFWLDPKEAKNQGLAKAASPLCLPLVVKQLLLFLSSCRTEACSMEICSPAPYEQIPKPRRPLSLRPLGPGRKFWHT